jgi:DDE superfamily endonuclease
VTTPVEIWFEDEARMGKKNGQVRQWARRGTRPRLPADQRYDNAYLFGAICPARGVGAALALPYADADMMQLHLDEISRHVAEGAHAVLLFDRAGWHTTGKLDLPENITPIFLPPCGPLVGEDQGGGRAAAVVKEAVQTANLFDPRDPPPLPALARGGECADW